MAPTTQPVSFRNGSADIVGVLHLPEGSGASSRHPALVLVTPGSSVKEQIGAVYASRLSALGFATLAFDPSHQGASGGEPRDLENPAARIEDVRCAVDFLVTQPAIDEKRIGLLGICAGGGYAVSAAMTERRVRALATVVPVNIGRAFRQSVLSPGAVRGTLEAVGQERSAEARGGLARREPWIPDTAEAARSAGITDRDVLDAVDFYRTERGHHPGSTNRLLFQSLGPLMAFDAFHLVGELLEQPLQVVVGGRLGSTSSFEDGKLLFERAPNAEDFLVIEGAGHYDLYDRAPFVDEAVDRLGTFFGRHLG